MEFGFGKHPEFWAEVGSVLEHVSTKIDETAYREFEYTKNRRDGNLLSTARASWRTLDGNAVKRALAETGLSDLYEKFEECYPLFKSELILPWHGVNYYTLESLLIRTLQLSVEEYDNLDESHSSLLSQLIQFVESESLTLKVCVALAGFHDLSGEVSLRHASSNTHFKCRRFTDEEIDVIFGEKYQPFSMNRRIRSSLDMSFAGLVFEFETGLRKYHTGASPQRFDLEAYSRTENFIEFFHCYSYEPTYAMRAGFFYSSPFVARLTNQVVEFPGGPHGHFHLRPEALEPIRKLFDRKIESNVQIAIRRLSEACRKYADEDRILDAVISMEAILLNGEAGENTTKFTTRYAMLEPKLSDRITRAEKAASLYDLRSSIVHGSLPRTGKEKKLSKSEKRNLRQKMIREGAKLACECAREVLFRELAEGLPRSSSKWNEFIFEGGAKMNVVDHSAGANAGTSVPDELASPSRTLSRRSRVSKSKL